MARQPLAERRSAAREKIKALKAELAKMDAMAAERIGRIAVRAGLGELDIEDDALAQEFAAIVEKHKSA